MLQTVENTGGTIGYSSNIYFLQTPATVYFYDNLEVNALGF